VVGSVSTIILQLVFSSRIVQPWTKLALSVSVAVQNVEQKQVSNVRVSACRAGTGKNKKVIENSPPPASILA
jgi:hypothetical protein